MGVGSKGGLGGRQVGAELGGWMVAWPVSLDGRREIMCGACAETAGIRIRHGSMLLAGFEKGDAKRSLGSWSFLKPRREAASCLVNACVCCGCDDAPEETPALTRELAPGLLFLQQISTVGPVNVGLELRFIPLAWSECGDTALRLTVGDREINSPPRGVCEAAIDNRS